MKKTTVFLNEQLLQEAKKAVGAQSTREVIEIGLTSLVRQANREALRKELGTYDIDLNLEDLEALRNVP
jgi:Arc/MetJ family transcription regulator